MLLVGGIYHTGRDGVGCQKPFFLSIAAPATTATTNDAKTMARQGVPPDDGAGVGVVEMGGAGVGEREVVCAGATVTGVMAGDGGGKEGGVDVGVGVVVGGGPTSTSPRRAWSGASAS